MSLVCLIQARSDSTRYPKKCFATVKDGQNSLDLIYNTTKSIIPHTYFIVPDTDTSIISHLHHIKNYPYFTGPKEPLKRYLKVATALHATQIVRITADCAYLDPAQLLYLLTLSQQLHTDFMSNANPDRRHTIDGDDVEIMSLKFLNWLDVYSLPEHREHVTAYAYTCTPDKFKSANLQVAYYNPLINYNRLIKTSIDTPEDLDRLTEACV